MALRPHYRQEIEAMDPGRLVFLDEGGVSTSMARSRARAPQGRRAEAAAPDSRWQIMTVAAVVRRSGVAAEGTMPYAMDGDSFSAYVKQGLIPSPHAVRWW
jgi:hypothetical protein